MYMPYIHSCACRKYIYIYIYHNIFNYPFLYNYMQISFHFKLFE